jgi:uncharacterized lipoprotein YehR (DUF1307 family)
MKKKILMLIIILIILLSLVVLLITSGHKSGKMKCVYTSTSDVIETSSIYLITYKNNIVNNLETREVIVSNDKNMLDEYKTALELVYSEYNGLEYYDNSVTLKKNKLTTITKVNYEKLDINKFISIDKNNKDLFTNNQVKLSTLKKIYKKNGAKCRYI